jgi:hypothetical protein
VLGDGGNAGVLNGNTVEGLEAMDWMQRFACKGNLTNLRRELHLSLAKGNPK